MSAADRPPVDASDAGVYIHFPYCTRICPYCDFNVHTGPFDGAAYADAIAREIEARGAAYAPAGGFSTAYFGGGTPSLWAADEVGRVIDTVRANFGLAPGAEITLEANPESFEPDRLAGYLLAGVNRLSIGAQSFAADELTFLGRLHAGRDNKRAVRLAQSGGARVSVDLIYGLPGQRWSDIEASLEAMVALEPDHISAYTLTIEPNTHFGRLQAEGRLTVVEDDALADHYEAVAEYLSHAGYDHYEVSSFALPGREAIHNTLYWVGAPYLGVGAGAHSYLPGLRMSHAVRRENVRAPAAYLAGARDGSFPAEFEERVARESAIAERLIVGMRTRWGVDLKALGEETAAGPALVMALAPAFEELSAEGLLRWSGRRIAPTQEGFLMADAIARTLIARLPPR